MFSKFKNTIHYTGTLISQDYVVTAASIFDHGRITASSGYKTISVKDKENFAVLVAAEAKNYDFSSLESVRNQYATVYPDYDWTPIAEIKIHPHYASDNKEYAKVNFDVAMLKLEVRDGFKNCMISIYFSWSVSVAVGKKNECMYDLYSWRG